MNSRIVFATQHREQNIMTAKRHENQLIAIFPQKKIRKKSFFFWECRIQNTTGFKKFHATGLFSLTLTDTGH